ncbi:MAG: hypothetical protein ACXWH1_12800 [Thermoanaerobaculia bacterium]
MIRSIFLIVMLAPSLNQAWAPPTRSPRPEARGPRPCCAEITGLVSPINSAPQLVIPAAGSGAGANGTFFRSDITVINFGEAAQRIQLRWLPQAGGSGSQTEITIPAHAGLVSEDFVTSILGVQGLGSILIDGVNDSGAIDSSAKLHATSRIWTPQPGSTGSTSQSLNVVPLSTIRTSGGAIYGLRRDERYRVNVGIVNLDAAATVTFLVLIPRTTEAYSVTIPPMSMQQVALVNSANALSQINIGTGGIDTVWVAYGSSIDNVTGDSWSELAVQPIQPGSSERDH